MTTRSASSLFRVAAMLLTSAGLGRAETIKPTRVEGAIQWVYDYEEGRKLAGANGKPLMVVFRCER
jgi:hypothetical protein